ncbi:MAG TPA: EamA family transporter [Terriglobales bacterium]|nr:EamA family transporter [Terriglobales bacterium]
MANKPHPIRGYAFIAAATLLWGISATLGRAAFTGKLLPSGQALQPIDPVILSQSRVTISFIVLFPILALRRGWRNLKLPLADFGRLALLGVLGIAASNYLYYLAIKRTNVATAIILQYTAPVLVLLYMVARGLQKATAQRVTAVVLSVLGSALAIGVVGTSGLRLDGIGVMAALLAAVSFAFDNIAGHRILARYDRWIVLLYTTLTAGAFWLIVNPPWRLVAAHYSGWQWGFLAVFALVSVLAPFSFYFAGLQHLEPTRAIVASCLEPVFSILLAAFLLGEALRPAQVLGIVIVLAAIVIVQLPERPGAEATVVEPIE